ncbi:MAG: hypothetical protein KAJ07_00485 [Planctomycetes bacterium]|nr:hypothetical protein [Planctomycetota bacterium]
MVEPITLALGLSAGASILSSIFGGKAQERGARAAAEATTTAARESTALLREQFETTREDLEPFREFGTAALQSLGDLLGLTTPGREPSAQFGSLTEPFTGEGLAEDPGFQFRLKTGTEAIEKSAAARGKLLSGETGKALTAFGQEFASTEFERAFNRRRTEQQDVFSRLFGISEAGRGATVTGAQAGLGTAQAQAGNINLAGQARAQAEINAANARASTFSGINQAIQGTTGNILFSNFLGNRPVAPTTTTAPVALPGGAAGAIRPRPIFT